MESDDPKSKQVLQSFIEELYKDHEWRKSKNTAFEKLEDAYEHSVLNENKMAAVRKKVAENIDKALGTNLAEKKLVKSLKKIENTLFGKAKEK